MACLYYPSGLELKVLNFVHTQNDLGYFPRTVDVAQAMGTDLVTANLIMGFLMGGFVEGGVVPYNLH